MLEVDCSVLTPEIVFKTSGHVDRFADWMCKDPKFGDILRADHFVEEILEARLKGNKKARGQKVDEEEDGKKKKKKIKGAQEAVPLSKEVVKEYEEVLAKIDNYSGPELGELIRKYDLRHPKSDMQPTEPVAFNLMFGTKIGPSSNLAGYLRPETAQGQFMNFAKLLEFNQGAMPFASASVGKSYRNEISPRAGLLRVREFLMAEIEHFVDPESGKKHARFHEVEDVELDLLDRHTQLSGQTTITKMTIGKAVKDGIVDNETLGYFLARIYLFLKKIGVDMRKVRFRQHMANEMTDKPLLVRQRLETPRTVSEWEVTIERKKFGPWFKKDSKAVEAVILSSTQECREKWAKELEDSGKAIIEVPGLGNVDVNKDLLQVEYRSRTEHVRDYTPNVIEPSFGIGRILYALCEHAYWWREGGDEARSVLSFPPAIAPTKVIIMPLSSNKDFIPHVTRLSQKLRAAQISTRVDDSSASIGKRYSRNDELGTSLGLTVDFQTLKDGTITLRERDTTRQVRADTDTILTAIREIVGGSKTWEDIEKELPVFESQDVEDQ
ncbi:Glycine--tRNA ligase 1, mitochondrial [Diatrype stigma]|uniref:glycine--tRNA ligase n=1 Tax=Diatrype stigma TaxID=117547 RepID=A0AAN9UT90_9PEZI